MTAVYRKTLLSLGKVRVRIAMTRRKARLRIDYRGDGSFRRAHSNAFR